jgi:K+-transporting ATPase ATPase C chain
MENNASILGPIVRTSFLIMILCGFIYPVAVTGIAQVIMPEKADGSFIYNEQHQIIGSALIGQQFTDPAYFHGRVSSIEYDGTGSGSNNYAPSNEDMMDRTQESVEAWKRENPDTPISKVPMDLLTNSGSGLDPHVSPEAAMAQVNRVSEKTGIAKEELVSLIQKHTQGRELGLFGEERVNVLRLNLDVMKRQS